MNYHDIKHDDMLNGDGIRVVLFVSGCSHHCEGCQNKETWEPDSGIKFDDAALEEIMGELEKDYVAGLTLSGGDPLYCQNRPEVIRIIEAVRKRFPEKSIWMYTGFDIEEIFESNSLCNVATMVDVLVTGRFVAELVDANTPYVGSTNQEIYEVTKMLDGSYLFEKIQ